MPLSFAVVCEARADKETATGFADSIFCAKRGLEQAQVEQRCAWRGLLQADEFLAWKDVARIARERNLRLHGYFDGKPGAPDAHAGRRALALLRLFSYPPNAIFLIRDDDREAERRKGLEQSREEAARRGMTAPVVIGLAHPKREAWVLAGFVPGSEQEHHTLDNLTRELSFSPVQEPERLNGKPGEPREIKGVVNKLTGGDKEREAQCWQRTSVEELRRRGVATGLSAYLQEVEERIVPLFSGA